MDATSCGMFVCRAALETYEKKFALPPSQQLDRYLMHDVLQCMHTLFVNSPNLPPGAPLPLPNKGHWCFLNVLLQLLAATRCITAYVKDLRSKHEDDPFTRDFLSLLSVLSKPYARRAGVDASFLEGLLAALSAKSHVHLSAGPQELETALSALLIGQKSSAPALKAEVSAYNADCLLHRTKITQRCHGHEVTTEQGMSAFFFFSLDYLLSLKYPLQECPPFFIVSPLQKLLMYPSLHYLNCRGQHVMLLDAVSA